MTCDCAANEEKVLGCFNTETAQEEFHSLSGTIYVGCWNTGVQKELAIDGIESYVVKWDQSIEKLYICVVTTSTTTTTTSTTTPTTTLETTTTTTVATTVTTVTTTSITTITTATTSLTTVTTTVTTTEETTTTPPPTTTTAECSCSSAILVVTIIDPIIVEGCSAGCPTTGSWECAAVEGKTYTHISSDGKVIVTCAGGLDGVMINGNPGLCFTWVGTLPLDATELPNSLIGCSFGINGHDGTVTVTCP